MGPPKHLNNNFKQHLLFFKMTWSPDYKANRFGRLRRMKIKDRCNYDRVREYFAVLNGQEKAEDVPRTYCDFTQRRGMFGGHMNVPTVSFEVAQKNRSSQMSAKGKDAFADVVEYDGHRVHGEFKLDASSLDAWKNMVSGFMASEQTRVKSFMT